MRITYIHQHYPRLPEEGGLGRPWQFAKRLANDGHDVTLVAGSATARKTVIDGVRIVHVRAPYATEFGTIRRVIAFLSFLVKATILSVRIPSDVVFASSTPLTVAIPGVIGALFNRARFVFEVRDLWPKVPIELGILTNPLLQFVAKGLERIAYRRAATVVALSDGMAEGVRDVNPNVPIATVPNASDFDLFSGEIAHRDEVRAALGWEQDERVLVYAGSLGYIYRITWIVDLAARLRPLGIRVVIYGAGGQFPILVEKARSLDLDVNALFPGRLKRQDLAKAISACDATISSVLSEKCLEPASINKVFEAMAARKGVFFNHDGWLTELLTAHGAGWRLDDEPEVAAIQIQEIMANPRVLSEAGRRSASLGLERFERDKLYRDFRSAVIGSSGFTTHATTQI